MIRRKKEKLIRKWDKTDVHIMLAWLSVQDDVFTPCCNITSITFYSLTHTSTRFYEASYPAGCSVLPGRHPFIKNSGSQVGDKTRQDYGPGRTGLVTTALM